MVKELKKILYAEDEEDIRAIAQIALEDIGNFSVTYCLNGKEVIDNIIQFNPDLVLLDVMMPEMDGPTTLKAIRMMPQFDHIPIIFMTAKIQPSEVISYKDLGVVEIITKPFDPMTLSAQLIKAWRETVTQD